MHYKEVVKCFLMLLQFLHTFLLCLLQQWCCRIRSSLSMCRCHQHYTSIVSVTSLWMIVCCWNSSSMPVIEGGHHDERRPCMGNPVKCLRNCIGLNMVKLSSRFLEDLENISQYKMELLAMILEWIVSNNNIILNNDLVVSLSGNAHLTYCSSELRVLDIGSDDTKSDLGSDNTRSDFRPISIFLKSVWKFCFM